MYTNLNVLCDILEKERNEKTVVLATGTFDLFHYNHLKYLCDAKKNGDILVVAVKNNKCAALKGKGRPIIDEFQRVAIIDAIKYVDYTILVDYNPETIVEIDADNGRQEEWLIIFSEVFKLLKPDVLYYEINPILQSARDRVFQKYKIKGVSVERGIFDSISTTEIIKRINKIKS